MHDRTGSTQRLQYGRERKVRRRTGSDFQFEGSRREVYCPRAVVGFEFGVVTCCITRHKDSTGEPVRFTGDPGPLSVLAHNETASAGV
jgi:hypothetical protein